MNVKRYFPGIFQARLDPFLKIDPGLIGFPWLADSIGRSVIK